MHFENLMALHIAIEYKVPQEKAFTMLDKFLDTGVLRRRIYRWSKDDLEDMKKLKAKGLMLKEIADIYGVGLSRMSEILSL